MLMRKSTHIKLVEELTKDLTNERRWAKGFEREKEALSKEIKSLTSENRKLEYKINPPKPLPIMIYSFRLGNDLVEVEGDTIEKPNEYSSRPDTYVPRYVVKKNYKEVAEFKASEVASLTTRVK